MKDGKEGRVREEELEIIQTEMSMQFIVKEQHLPTWSQESLVRGFQYTPCREH